MAGSDLSPIPGHVELRPTKIHRWQEKRRLLSRIRRDAEGPVTEVVAQPHHKSLIDVCVGSPLSCQAQDHPVRRRASE